MLYNLMYVCVNIRNEIMVIRFWKKAWIQVWPRDSITPHFDFFLKYASMDLCNLEQAPNARD